MCQLKKFENRLRFDGITVMSLASFFLEHRVYQFCVVIAARVVFILLFVRRGLRQILSSAVVVVFSMSFKMQPSGLRVPSLQWHSRQTVQRFRV